MSSARRALRVLAALVVPWSLAACRRAEATGSTAPPAPAVLAAPLVAKADPPMVRHGAMGASARLRLGFDKPGVIAEMTVASGERVKKGQLLARLRDGEAAAVARAAAAEESDADRDLVSLTALAATGSTSPNAKARAADHLAYVKAQRARARESLSMTQLRAPVAGTIYQRIAEPGEAVMAGAPVLLLEATSKPVVRVAVSERDLPRLQVGQDAGLRCGDAVTGRGVVTMIAPAPDAADGLYRVEVAPSPAGRFDCVLGADVDVELTGGAASASLRVPIGAVVYRRGAPIVFVVDGAEGHESVSERAIAVGRVEGTEIVVHDGLAAGERIVLEGGGFLVDGESVRVLAR